VLSGDQTFSGSNIFAGVLFATNQDNNFVGRFAGNGSALTGLNPASLSAGTAAISISGNAASATMANNFAGSLAGDVTGTQGATVVSSVGGQTASSVAVAAGIVNAATSASSPFTLVKRDGSGNFSAGTITANLAGNATSATTAANVTGNIADAQLSGNVARLNGTNIFTGTNNLMGVVMATNVNNLLNGTFTGNVVGNVAGNATTATTAATVGGVAVSNLPAQILSGQPTTNHSS
jgi:hypothetical protein